MYRTTDRQIVTDTDRQGQIQTRQGQIQTDSNRYRLTATDTDSQQQIQTHRQTDSD